MQCSFIKPNGERCGANAMVDSPFCFSHNPEAVEAKMEAVVRGGLAARKNGEQLEPIEIRSVEDVISLIEDTINRIRTTDMSHQQANSIGYLSGIILKALEADSLESRLNNIQNVLERREN